MLKNLAMTRKKKQQIVWILDSGQSSEDFSRNNRRKVLVIIHDNAPSNGRGKEFFVVAKGIQSNVDEDIDSDYWAGGKICS